MIHNVFTIVRTVSVGRKSVCIPSFSYRLLVFALYSLVIVKEKLDWITYRRKRWNTSVGKIYECINNKFYGIEVNIDGCLDDADDE